MGKITEKFALSTDDIVKFLNERSSYPEKTEVLTIKETHMSWLFLTDQFAYKMKKPVRYPYLDFSTLEKRKRSCDEEVNLNRRLAPDIYIGVVALIQEDSGNLKLEGNGQVIEWLVKMNRLPTELMLDQKIVNKNIQQEDLLRLGVALSDFYQRPQIPKMDQQFYIQRLRSFLYENLNELKQEEFGIDESRINKLLQDQLKFLSDHILALKNRTEKIVEVHGDLRPDHICLLKNPVIIDCIEFSNDLRILDPLEELAFFSIECEMLDSAWIGDKVLEVYQNETQDFLDNDIINFYKSIRAVLRALASFRHILEPKYLSEIKWKTKGEKYLELADKYMGIIAK